MSQRFRQIHDRIWIYTASEQGGVQEPNIGVIITSGQTILIDAGTSPRHAEYVQNALDEINAPPVHMILYTHHHWDHTLGASTYTPSTIIAHETTAHHLEEKYGNNLNKIFFSENKPENPLITAHNSRIQRAITKPRNFRMAFPTITFSKGMTLFFDSITIQLVHVGGRHASDSCIALVKEMGVLFTGDCYYPPPLHERTDAGDNDLDINILHHLSQYDAKIIVDGHSEKPFSGNELKQWIAKHPSNS